MCETLAFIQTGCSILSVAYYKRFWRFCGYRCVSKDKLTGRRSGHTVTRTQFYSFSGEKTLYRNKKARLEFEFSYHYHITVELLLTSALGPIHVIPCKIQGNKKIKVIRYIVFMTVTLATSSWSVTISQNASPLSSLQSFSVKKTNPTMIYSHAFSTPVWRELHRFASSSDWFI